MDSFIKNFRTLFSFSISLFSFSCFSLSSNSNFVLVSSAARPSYVEYRAPQNHFASEQLQLQQNLRKFDSKCQGLFSIYSSSNSILPKIVTKKDNKIFLYSHNNKLEPLGFLLPSDSKSLSKMENSVVEGKLLLGFENKAHLPVALVRDHNGVVYSVTRLSKQHFSIQSLGILSNNG